MENQNQSQTAMIAPEEVSRLRGELEAIKSKDMAKLGDGTCFWITEAGQKKRGFKAKVTLDFPNHFCFPGYGKNAKPMITGEGYDKANQFANIEVFRPRTLMGQDGVEKGNPYFERDPRNNSIISIFLRGIGIGYGPTGNLVAVDQTIFLNLNTLLVQEIQSKLKKFPYLGMLGHESKQPTEIVYYKDNGKYGDLRVIDKNPTTITNPQGVWTFVPHIAGMGYWVDISHPLILECFDSITQKQRYIERTAFTILKRLILSSHPAIGVKTPIITRADRDQKDRVVGANAHIFVYGFRFEEDGKQRHREIQAMVDRVSHGESAANMELIQQSAQDGYEEDDLDPSEYADPSEVNLDSDPANPENETDGPGQLLTPTVEKTVSDDPLENVKQIFLDQSNSPVAQKIRKELNQKDWTRIKTDPLMAAEFLKRFNEAKGANA